MYFKVNEYKYRAKVSTTQKGFIHMMMWSLFFRKLKKKPFVQGVKIEH